MYQRKTFDEWEVQANYGDGWDVVTTEETRKEAYEQMKCYDENEIGVPHRIVKKRRRYQWCIDRRTAHAITDRPFMTFDREEDAIAKCSSLQETARLSCDHKYMYRVRKEVV